MAILFLNLATWNEISSKELLMTKITFGAAWCLNLGLLRSYCYFLEPGIQGNWGVKARTIAVGLYEGGFQN